MDLLVEEAESGAQISQNGRWGRMGEAAPLKEDIRLSRQGKDHKVYLKNRWGKTIKIK